MKKHVVIIGAGPAGLACARELLRTGKNRYAVTIIEKDSQVGGLAKTILHKGYRFDIGGHRFYTKIPEVQTLYKTLLGSDMLVRKRVSRIYYQGKLYKYPLEIADVLTKIGLVTAWRIIASYISRQFHRFRREKNFTEWVSNRFGDVLFSIFFQSYTEKVWGVPTSELSATWAKQRIQNFSLPIAVLSAIFRFNIFRVKTIITEFMYPKLGPGMFYEKMHKQIQKSGGNVALKHALVGIKIKSRRCTHVEIQSSKKRFVLACDYLVNTAPLHKFLIMCRPPQNIRRVVRKLKFRSFIAVNFIIRGRSFPDNWIYIHDPAVRVGRIQNYASWSPHMTKNPLHSPITMEYFCNEDDPLWLATDASLIKSALLEAQVLSLFTESNVIDSFVVRVPDAYPVYRIHYEVQLHSAQTYLSTFDNLFTCGRGGLFRYNNMDHSIETGLRTARAIIGRSKRSTLWNLPPETYLEEQN